MADDMTDAERLAEACAEFEDAYVAAAAQIEEARALHRPKFGECIEDRQDWPCATIVTLGGER